MAAILAIAGIVMMTYADGFHSHTVMGIALVVGSASMSALYKVRLASLGQRAQCSAGRPALREPPPVPVPQEALGSPWGAGETLPSPGRLASALQASRQWPNLCSM